MATGWMAVALAQRLLDLEDPEKLFSRFQLLRKDHAHSVLTSKVTHMVPSPVSSMYENWVRAHRENRGYMPAGAEMFA